MVIDYDLVKRVDLCFARPENLAKIHILVGTRLVTSNFMIYCHISEVKRTTNLLLLAGRT
jgi:hypothetical protein